MRLRVGVLLFLMLNTMACSSLSLQWTCDRPVDFTLITHYRWLGVRAARTQAVADHLKTVLERELTGRGLAECPERAQLSIVAYFEPIRSPQRRTEDHPITLLGGLVALAAVVAGARDIQLNKPNTERRREHHNVRQLRIEFRSLDSGALLWSGTATGPFAARMSETDQLSLTEEAVVDLLGG